MGLLKYLSNGVSTVDRFVDNVVEGKRNPWDEAYQSVKAEHIRDYERNPDAAALYLEACRRERIAEDSREIGDWASSMMQSLKKGYYDDKISKQCLDDLLARVEKVRFHMLEHVTKSSDAFEDNDAFTIQVVCEKERVRWYDLPI